MTYSEAELSKVRRAMIATERLHLDGLKDIQLNRRIESFLGRHRLDGVDQLVAGLLSDDKLRQAFIDRLTINVTNLFRNAERWQYLIDNVLSTFPRNCRIWSAGCSNGAEAYSMVVAGAAAGVEAKVIGSDIDRESLNHAKRGIYPEVDMREVPAGIRSRYFRKS